MSTSAVYVRDRKNRAMRQSAQSGEDTGDSILMSHGLAHSVIAHTDGTRALYVEKKINPVRVIPLFQLKNDLQTYIYGRI
jgi:hypothetical protein